MRAAAAARLAALAALATLLLSALPAAEAHSGAGNNFHVRAQDGGGQSWFTFEGLPGRNPSLVLQPHTTYTFEMTNDGSTQHDLRIGDTQVVRLLNKGETASGTFTTGEDGTLEYSCAPHRALGMKGRMSVGTGQDNGAPAPFLVVPLGLAVAGLLRRSRPEA